MVDHIACVMVSGTPQYGATACENCGRLHHGDEQHGYETIDVFRGVNPPTRAFWNWVTGAVFFKEYEYEPRKETTEETIAAQA